MKLLTGSMKLANKGEHLAAKRARYFYCELVKIKTEREDVILHLNLLGEW